MRDYYLKLSGAPFMTPEGDAVMSCYLMYTKRTTTDISKAYLVPANVEFNEKDVRKHYGIYSTVKVEQVFVETIKDTVDHLSAI